jgi:G3E family GTPase
MTLARKFTTVHHQFSSAANTVSSSINVDASLIKQTHTINQTKEKVIALQNGCICCTLRGDLLQELVRISKLQTFDYMIIESSGISEPEQVSETFDDRFAQQMMDMGSIEGAPGLDEESIRILKEVYAP